MAKTSYPQLVMLGPASGTRDGVASVVEAYRAQRLFQRWPIEYLETYGDDGLYANARRLLVALVRFVTLLWR